MDKVYRLTPQEVLAKWSCAEREYLWSNKYKPLKEAWCVAKMCISADLDNSLISAPIEEPVDVLLESKGHQYPIQVVMESNGRKLSSTRGPKNKPQIELDDWILGWRDFTALIKNVIKRKSEYYPIKSIQNIGLLVYVNISMFDYDEELNHSELIDFCKESPFSHIILLTDGQAKIIKGQFH